MLFLLYKAADPERLTLTDDVRRSAPGRFVRLTDGYTHYDLAGPPNGPAVVLVAGFSVPYYIWDPTFQALAAAGFRVLRYDYFGRGYSDRPDVPYVDDFYLRQLSELLDAAGITKPIDLAGLSMGAGVVTSFADRYPERVRSLIYMDPSFRTPHSTSWLERWPAAWNFVTVLTEQRLWADSQLEDFFQPERFPDWPAQYRVQMQFRGFRRARLSELVSNASADQGEQLERVSEHPRPVLVVWGKEDKNVPFVQSESLLERMPRARLVAVESAGHLPHIEQPAVVNTAIIEFLRFVGAQSGSSTR
jgi:pimeloyl-ACP methyl ester carboxylesterase